MKNAKYVEQKNDATRKFIVHKKRATQFHLMINETEEGTKTYCFDLQQAQQLPKLPIQEFYSLQISFYAFCIVDVMYSRSHCFYTWTEDQCVRGSNALVIFLKSSDWAGCNKYDYLLTDVEIRIRTATLYTYLCDGSRNIHLQISQKLRRYLFPVTKHSYLPADRAFGRVEKELRKHPEVLLFKDDENICKNLELFKNLDLVLFKILSRFYSFERRLKA